MGRKLRPSEVLKLEKGKLYDKQAEREKNEPKEIKIMKPTCPSRFSKDERKIWKGITKILDNYGLFNIANAMLIEMLTKAWHQYTYCCEMIDNEDIIVQGHGGRTSYNKYFNLQQKLGLIIMKYLSELGLSSTGLAKLGSLLATGEKERDDMENLMD